jgi:hypothetical protein
MKFFISLTLLSAVAGFAEFHDGPTGGDMGGTTGGDSGGISGGFNPVTDCPEITYFEDCINTMGCLGLAEDNCGYDSCFDIKDEEECDQLSPSELKPMGCSFKTLGGEYRCSWSEYYPPSCPEIVDEEECDNTDDCFFDFELGPDGECDYENPGWGYQPGP